MERLYHHGLCPSCARERSVREVLTSTQGHLRPELDGVRLALLKPPSRTMLRWIHKTPARRAAFRAHSLGRRLENLGIRPRAARNASLMDIASELPAYVFSRLLGFSQSTADNWDIEASGFGPAYGAEIARRTRDH
ncbi:hypothetical protein ABZ746_35540 [Streptomyces sp. NPDC020096]